MELVLASRNAKKIEELRRILAAAGLDAVVRGPEAFTDLPEIPEIGATFSENAMHKAVAVASATGLVAVADDSGLCVDALNGMPGVLSARWAGGHGDDAANVRLVLDQMRDVPDRRRGAHFACAAAVAVPGEDGSIVDMRVVEGIAEGALARSPRGERGFGYDPIFVPEGFAVTAAELTSAEKDAISHRGKALRSLADLLREMIPDS
ncbi:MAG: RdgB/HAM1 family non-canonical purine NTP pyrophosphatase [Candidatus Nanopelagicales bacterium]|nr:RdgB/HAM1 family non-canonical purine NTP pyrophosphatase [Candidatus Nanopelagicales bacterium]